MGVMNTIFGSGGGATAEEPEQKYAVLLNAGPDDPPVASNGFQYALELDDAGYEVQIFLDGEATKWPATFAEDPDLPFSSEWEALHERGLVTGACGYCANAFEVADSYTESEVDLLTDATEHAPGVAQLADEGYELLTV